jgi:hypothetical protein
MLPNERRSDEVSDLEFEEDLRRLDRLDEQPLVDTQYAYADVINAQSATGVVQQLAHFNEDWIFRGQKDAEWGLKPSIERLGSKGSWNRQEQAALKEFRDRATKYADQFTPPGNNLAWLAMLQHYGGPTRLLDWTEDPEVAAFFAVADADQETASAVWAINHTAIASESERLLSLSHRTFENDEVFQNTFFRATWPFVVRHVDTCQPCNRQQEQKGLFLCSNATQWEYRFETCLKNVLEYCPKDQPRWLCKITIPPEARDELLANLTRRSVTYERLFPGLGGLGRSLGIIASIRSDYFTDYYPEFGSEEGRVATFRSPSSGPGE